MFTDESGRQGATRKALTVTDYDMGLILTLRMNFSEWAHHNMIVTKEVKEDYNTESQNWISHFKVIWAWH